MSLKKVAIRGSGALVFAALSRIDRLAMGVCDVVVRATEPAILPQPVHESTRGP